VKIEQRVLSSKLSKLKGIVPKRDNMPELQGVLVSDGWMTATNLQLTIKARIPGIDPGERLVIPLDAFDLIAGLPEGDVEITEKDGNIIIRTDMIENEFSSIPPEQFPSSGYVLKEGNAVMSALDLQQKLSNVLWAVSKKDARPTLRSLYIECKDGTANFVGLDGHTIAWDTLPYEGDVSLLIPRDCIEQLLRLDMKGDVKILHDRMHSAFVTEDYVIETRLTDGAFFDYRKMFGHKKDTHEIVINRKIFLEAIRRAALFVDDITPIILHFDGPTVVIRVASPRSKYKECVLLENEMDGSLDIAFAPNVLIGNITAFSGETINFSLGSSKEPLVCNEKGVNLTTFTLPVNKH